MVPRTNTSGIRRLSLFTGALALLVTVLPGLDTGAAEGWVTDYEAAKKQAEKEKKDILIDFTGSDWCGWCIKLHSEVFSQEEFKKAADSKYVLLELDFPRAKELDEKLKAQNESLSQQFGVQGFPTIFLVDAKGRPYAQTGYQPGGAENYVKHLTSLQSAKSKRDEHFASAEKAKGVERAKHLDAGLTALTKQDTPIALLPGYAKEIEQIVALDAENEAGLKAAYEQRLLDFQLGSELTKIERALSSGEDRDAAMKSAEELLKKTGGKGEIAQKLFLMKAQLAFQDNEDDPSKGIPLVIELLQKSIDAAPETQFGKQLPQVITRLRGELEKSAGDEPEDEGDEDEDEK